MSYQSSSPEKDWPPMHEINHHPPELMPPDRRRAEVASLLARGLARLRMAPATTSANVAAESGFPLGFPGNQSVHADTVNNEETESK
jgi:hypothetical protein